MKIAIIGLPGSGKTTIFNALTGAHAEIGYAPVAPGKIKVNVGAAKVPDERLLKLAELFHSKKVSPALVEYIDFAALDLKVASRGELGAQLLSHLQGADAVAHVIRAFEHPSLTAPQPLKDCEDVETEMLLSDMETIEGRMERLRQALKKGDKKADPDELSLLEKCANWLSDGQPLRGLDLDRDAEERLKNFGLLTEKPLLRIFNIPERMMNSPEAQELLRRPEGAKPSPKSASIALCGKLEMEIYQLPKEDVKPFMEELGLEELALGKMVKASIELIGLMTFYTTARDEARAWLIPQGTTALKAAGKIHSDMEKGFIKAEVISYDELLACGSISTARAKGLLRIEGKDYIVKDGDHLTVRFSP